MKKIVLFNPSPRGFTGEDRNFITPPLSLLVAASGIMDLPYEKILIDEIFEPEEKYRAKLTSMKDDLFLVGITTMTGHQIGNAVRFASFMRGLDKNIPLVWGGYHPSALPEQTLADERVDIVCIGQGPQTLRDIVLALQDKTDLLHVKGIGFKKNGEIIITESRPITNINQLPLIPYELIDLNKYISDPTGSGDRVMGYISSQGCPWKCSFCAEINMTKRRWSGLEAKRVVDDWEYFNKKYGVTHITLYDSMFVANPYRVKEIANELKRRNLNISMGFINARTEQIARFDEEFFQLLKDLHCTTFLIGAEGGSDEVLLAIDKQANIQHTIDAKKKLSKYGFTPMFSFMIGLEFDLKKNKKEFNDLLNICDKISEIDDNNIFNIWNYVPYVGAPLTEKAIAAGYKPPQSLEEYAAFHFSATHVPWVHKKYTLWLEMLRNMIFPYTSIQFRPGGVWDQNYDGKHKFIKQVLHRFIRQVCFLRLKYRFFYLPFDYYLFKKWQQKARKDDLVGQIAPDQNSQKDLVASKLTTVEPAC